MKKEAALPIPFRAALRVWVNVALLIAPKELRASQAGHFSGNVAYRMVYRDLNPGV